MLSGARAVICLSTSNKKAGTRTYARSLSPRWANPKQGTNDIKKKSNLWRKRDLRLPHPSSKQHHKCRRRLCRRLLHPPETQNHDSARSSDLRLLPLKLCEASNSLPRLVALPAHMERLREDVSSTCSSTYVQEQRVAGGLGQNSPVSHDTSDEAAYPSAKWR